jgi:probable phosphoglycerate mutase
MSTRFCLVRHGETDWNAEKRVQGQIDIGLNATGEAQARALADALSEHDFAAVYSSDLARAWRTAGIAVQARKIAVSPAPTLRERHFGVLQGLTAAEAGMAKPAAYRLHRERNPDFDYETGESLNRFADRVLTGLATIAQRHAGESVLAFTHGGVLDVVYRAATGRAIDAPRDFTLGNAALNWLDYNGGRWQLIAWADSRHLRAALDELPG